MDLAPVVTVLAAGGLTLTGTALGAYLTRKQTDSGWLRQTRFDTYMESLARLRDVESAVDALHEYLQEAEPAPDAVAALLANARVAVDALRETYHHVQMIGGDRILGATGDIIETLDDLLHGPGEIRALQETHSENLDEMIGLILVRFIDAAAVDVGIANPARHRRRLRKLKPFSLEDHPLPPRPGAFP